jgi:putative glutathione S-transferase
MSTITAATPFDRHTTLPTASDELWRLRFQSELLEHARAAGLTIDPQVYAANYARYFASLDALDVELNECRHLLGGDEPSAADQWFALFLWLQGSVFYGLYKLNRQRLEEFCNLAHYVRDIFGDPALRNHVDFEALKKHYNRESKLINPKQRMPLGSVDLDSPHDRVLRFGRGSGKSDIEEDQSVAANAGEWKRKTSGHRSRITPDGASGFAPEPGRYHLYIANNCPWCHRAALTRKLKGLDDVISMDVLYYRRDPDRGWQFRPSEPGCTADTLFGYQAIRDLYDRVGSRETSVPVLWDRETQTIVSNESAEIIRMFEEGFPELSQNTPTLYPVALQTQIDRVNEFTYHAINNGAYKAGFADSQVAYETAYRTFFDALETLGHMLRGRGFLLGNSITEADVRLFPTIFRFDPVYYVRFNLNERMVRDIPSLSRWLTDMLAIPEIAAASNLDHCRKGYFGRTGNNLVPLGPSRMGPV